VTPDNVETPTGDTEPVAQNNAAIAAPAVALADGSEWKAKTESIKQAGLPGVSTAQGWKEKRQPKPAASESRPYAAVDNAPQVRDAAITEFLRPDAAAGQRVASDSDPGLTRFNTGQAPANLPFASHRNQSSVKAEPHEGLEARVIPLPVVSATASLTGLPAAKSLVGQCTKDSAQPGGVAPNSEATHVAVNLATVPEATVLHTPAQTAWPLTTIVSPSLVLPSAILNHGSNAQGIEMSDQGHIASGPPHLDVGVFDGTHGWLRIRAELNPAGAVYASLTANASAHVLLKSALPEMASYLISEAVGVSKIAVHRFDAGNGATTGQSNESAARFGGSNQRGQDSGLHKQRTVGPESYGEQSEALVTPGVLRSSGLLDGMSGGWLNVCA
jgi:hypothetical protein